MKCNNLIRKLNRYLTNKFDIYPEMGCDKEAEYCIKETAQEIFKDIKDIKDNNRCTYNPFHYCPNCDCGFEVAIRAKEIEQLKQKYGVD